MPKAKSYRRPDYSWETRLQYVTAELLDSNPYWRKAGYTRADWPHERLPRRRKVSPVPEAYVNHPNWPDLGGEAIE